MKKPGLCYSLCVVLSSFGELENVWVFEKSMGFLRGIRVTTRTLRGFVWSFLVAWMSRGFPSDLTWSFLAAWMSRGFSSILMFYHYYGATGTNRFDVQYWSCHVEQTHDDPEKRTVKGMVKFEVKQELQDVKQWFLSVFGNMMCEHLSVKEHEQEINPYKQKPPPDYFKHRCLKKYGYRMDLNGWDDDIY